jgi:16S rRNA (guanine527-N7)-methyltransferase
MIMLQIQIVSREVRRMSEGEAAGDRERGLALVPVPRETEECFDIFVRVLARWRKKINLISEATFASVWTRHIADSAQIRLMSPTTIRWLDIGSGAGFPGIVLAMQLAAVRGGMVHCVESDRRKCAFLREVARATCAPAIVHSIRIQSITASALGTVDGVTARAFAPLIRTLDVAQHWLRPGTLGVFPRGRSVAKQIEYIYPYSKLHLESIPSIVDVSASFLKVRVD